MKTAFLLLIACTVASVSLASQKTTRIPAAVHRSFSHQYQNVSVQQWNHDHDTLIATFDTDRRKHYAYYSFNGSWIKTATEIKTRNLPMCVKQTFNRSEFASWRIDGVNLTEFPNYCYYTIAVFQETGPGGSILGDLVDKYVLYFSTDGAMVKINHVE